jgi:hypothetical protein
MFRINMEHYSCDLAPVSTIDLCVEQPQIRDEVFLVVDGQHRIGRRGITTSGSSGGFCMDVLATGC